MLLLFAKMFWYLLFLCGFSMAFDVNYDFAQNYDFIVVGSGSSGSVIANRLTEVKRWRVLLLEVGDVAHFLTEAPGMAAVFQFSNYNWGYLMEKEENVCLGMKRQRCPYPRGKVLGGSTIINYMIHVRGNQIDYDRWAALGNPGWSYKEVLPYFIKSEKSYLHHQDPGYHGFNGTLTVSDVPSRTKSSVAFIEAAQELGYPVVDYNGKTQFGFSYVQSTTHNGKRCSAEKAFLRPIRKRPNLRVSTRSRVTKILIKNGKTIGVEFVKDGHHFRVMVTKEVIVSAGAFHSPQLLMLSGVGPKRHLKELGVDLVKDLPVGGVMYDHVCFPGLVFKVDQPITINQGTLTNLYNLYEYVVNNRGVVTTLGGVEALGYIKTGVSTETLNYPDVELIFVGGGLHSDFGKAYRKTLGITKKIYDAVWKPLENRHAFSIFPMLLHPVSKGFVKLHSKNPFDSPRFYGRTFTDPKNVDLKTMIGAIRIIQTLVNTTTFQRYGASLVTTKIPGCERFTFNSDYYWECALRHLTTTLHHQIGTCKMGPKWDKESVVDHRLKVHGIANLRVADTSVIPLTLSAHTNIPAIMIGEKAADLIKHEWLGRSTNEPNQD